MYDFRIIDMPDGNQVIDRNLKTSYNTLTPIQILEYEEMDTQLYIMDRMERRGREEVSVETEIFEKCITGHSLSVWAGLRKIRYFHGIYITDGGISSRDEAGGSQVI